MADEMKIWKDEVKANSKRRVDADIDIDEHPVDMEEEYENNNSKESGDEPEGEYPEAMDEDEGLDLKAFFTHFGLNDFQQIAICRTYANHLAAKLPKRGPALKRPALKRSNAFVQRRRK